MTRKRRLKTAIDVRRYLAHLIHETEAKKMNPQTAGRLAYISNILLRAIEGGEVEKRIQEIEKILEERNIK